MTGGAFLVGAKNFEDSGTTFSEKIVPPARAPDAVEELPTSRYQSQLYRLSGDYNPLHISSDFAQMVGFKEPILHGLCTLGMSARGLLRAFAGNDPARFHSTPAFDESGKPNPSTLTNSEHERAPLVRGLPVGKNVRVCEYVFRSEEIPSILEKD